MIPVTARFDKPLYPFLLLLLLPPSAGASSFLVLLYLPSCVIGDESSWELRHVQLAFLAGLLNLLPFLWYVSPKPMVRWTSMMAGLIGAAIFALSQMGLVLPFIDGMTSAGSAWSCPGSVYVHPLYVVLVLLPAMLILWTVATLVGAAVLLKMTRDA